MKQVTITQRLVYHKTVSVTIDVPSEIGLHDIQLWLWENQDLYQDELDNELEQTPHSIGFGLDINNGLNDAEADSEIRFDFIEEDKITYGGHL